MVMQRETIKVEGQKMKYPYVPPLDFYAIVFNVLPTDLFFF